jgi:hypothetical protein
MNHEPKKQNPEKFYHCSIIQQYLIRKGSCVSVNFDMYFMSKTPSLSCFVYVCLLRKFAGDGAQAWQALNIFPTAPTF